MIGRGDSAPVLLARGEAGRERAKNKNAGLVAGVLYVQIRKCDQLARTITSTRRLSFLEPLGSLEPLPTTLKRLRATPLLAR